MASVVVDVALATICYLGQCHAALIGADTPKGEYTLTQRLVQSPGYGGDVLQFKEDDKEIYAIHRVWLLRPAEKRAERLKSKDPDVRRITKGCINVDPIVYQELVDCCSNASLVVR